MPRQGDKEKLVPVQRANSNSNKRSNNYTDIGIVGYNIEDIDSVLNAVRNLFSIGIGEVPFNRGLGSNLRNYLFGTNTKKTSILLLADLRAALGLFEPRVHIHNSSKITLDPDNRKVYLDLILQVEGVERLIPMKQTIDAFYDKNSKLY